MTTSHVIFLDIDGPMIPTRAYYLPGQTAIVSLFDPCASSMLSNLLEQRDDIRIVISSTHGQHGKQHIIDLFELNELDPNKLHTDWITPRKMSSYRSLEIAWWLSDHPEVTNWVAIDDEMLNREIVPNFAKCDTHNGFSWRNLLECKFYLEIFDHNEDKQSLADLIAYFKRKEIAQTFDQLTPHWDILDRASWTVFPRFSNLTGEK